MISLAVWMHYTCVTERRRDGHRSTASTAITHTVARYKHCVSLLLNAGAVIDSAAAWSLSVRVTQTPISFLPLPVF